MKKFSITHKSAANAYKTETTEMSSVSLEQVKEDMRLGLSGPIIISSILEIK